MKMAPIFPTRANRTMSVPAAWITRRDPEGKPTPARAQFYVFMRPIETFAFGKASKTNLRESR
jgi:hypothetical protein